MYAIRGNYSGGPQQRPLSRGVPGPLRGAEPHGRPPGEVGGGLEKTSQRGGVGPRYKANPPLGGHCHETPARTAESGKPGVVVVVGGGAPDASRGEISGRDVVGPAKLSTVPARGADGVWVRRDGVACLGASRGCTCPASRVMHRVLGSEPWSSGAKLSTDLARGADGVWVGRDGVACFGAPRGCTCPASRVMHRMLGPEPLTAVRRTSYAKPCDARVGGGKIPCSPTQPRSGCHRAGPLGC